VFEPARRATTEIAAEQDPRRQRPSMTGALESRPTNSNRVKVNVVVCESNPFGPPGRM